MKLKFRFAIHPIKMVPLNKRKDGWIQVFSQKPNNRELFIINTWRKLPLAFFSSYILLLSELGFLNGFGLFCMALYYTHGTIKIDRRENKKIRQLYVNQNGVDWAVSIQPNFYQRLSDENWTMNKELREILQIPKNQIIFKVNINEIKLLSSILSLDGIESMLKYRERIIKKEIESEDVKQNNQFELSYKDHIFSININENEQLGFDDYIRAFVLRQQLIIK